MNIQGELKAHEIQSTNQTAGDGEVSLTKEVLLLAALKWQAETHKEGIKTSRKRHHLKKSIGKDGGIHTAAVVTKKSWKQTLQSGRNAVRGHDVELPVWTRSKRRKWDMAGRLKTEHRTALQALNTCGKLLGR